MIVDIDHMGVKTADATLKLLEAANYSGVVSSHGWTDASNVPAHLHARRVRRAVRGALGELRGEWREARQSASDNYYFGFGFGADTNGFGTAGRAPRGRRREPAAYPFTTFDGGTVMDRQRTGDRSSTSTPTASRSTA